jgi:acyl carrier protein
MSTTTSPQQVRETILQILGRIAPDVQTNEIDGALDLRDQLDIDSMDFLNLVIGVHKALGVEIPEADYPKLVTLDGFVRYVTATSRTG